MLGLAGFVNGIQGIGVIVRKEYFAGAVVLYDNLQLWGWVWLILGVVQIGTAIALFDGRGRIMAMVLAGLSAVVAFISLGAAPAWGICIIALSVIAIWGLARQPEPGSAPSEPSIPPPGSRRSDMPPGPPR
jgi:hypothetical protein